METKINIKFYNLFIIALLLFLTGCENGGSNSKSPFLIFPVGRSILTSGSIDVKAGGRERHSGFLPDGCGGYWLQIPKNTLADNESIVITFSIKKGDLKLLSEPGGLRRDWLKPSYFIDSGSTNIVSKAAGLTRNLSSRTDKAKAIQQFVIRHTEMKIRKDSFLDKASSTYELGYGNCINFSRLYTALCRAAGIPARTVWGVVYGYNDDKIYDYHHQWAEICDESGDWHPSDFTYTTNFDLNDIRYLDLIYAAEENTIVKNRNLFDIMFKDIKYVDDYPATLTARLGFKLKTDGRPDSMVVEYKYEYKKQTRIFN